MRSKRELAIPVKKLGFYSSIELSCWTVFRQNVLFSTLKLLGKFCEQLQMSYFWMLNGQPFVICWSFRSSLRGLGVLNFGNAKKSYLNLFFFFWSGSPQRRENYCLLGAFRNVYLQTCLFYLPMRKRSHILEIGFTILLGK